MTKQHIGRPAPCTKCIDILLEFAETLQGRATASIYCPHGAAYVTVAVEDGRAYQWRTTGPVTVNEAKELHAAGQIVRKEFAAVEAELAAGDDPEDDPEDLN